MKRLNLDLDATLGGTAPSDYKSPAQSAIKSYIDEHSFVEHTYSELKALKDAGGLVPGCCYRITDFVTTSNGGGGPTDVITRSAGHPFDLIVIATSSSTFGEDAMAVPHSGDTYFSSCKMAAWDIRYCFDNDSARYEWADTTNGKGVIYFMRDEFNNECPYDFKNIQFKRKWNSTTSLHSDLGTADEGVFCYTFNTETSSSTVQDDCKDITVESGHRCSCNTVAPCVSTMSEAGTLNNIGKFGNGVENTFGKNCSNITVAKASYANTFAPGCSSISMGSTCYGNTFGQECRSITMGSGCSDNTFDNHTCNVIFASNSAGTKLGNNFIGNRIHYNPTGIILWSASTGEKRGYTIQALFSTAQGSRQSLEMVVPSYCERIAGCDSTGYYNRKVGCVIDLF